MGYNGKFILRIENTNKIKSYKYSEFKILKYLKWLKLFWNEGPDIGGVNKPYRQSQRLLHYNFYIKQMINYGYAYWCSCSKKRLNNLKKEQINNNTITKYDKVCLKKNKITI